MICAADESAASPNKRWQFRHETRYGEGWQTRDKPSAAEERFLMAETRAPGPAGHSKLLGDRESRLPNCALH